MKKLLKHRAWLFIWGIPIVVLVAWAGGWWFAAGVALITAMAGREVLKVMIPGKPPVGAMILTIGLLVMLPLGVMLHGLMALVWILIAGMLAAGSFALTFTPEQGYRALVAIVFALMYVGIPFTSLLLIRNDPIWQSQTEGALIVMYIWGGVWVTDTFAYLAGRTFGRHKLAPQLSPGKTVEGTVAGILFALIWAIGVGYYLGDVLSWTDRVLLGLIIGILAIIGDLVESMIKRVAHVKDSGSVLAAHGGVLDRFDSLLFVQPAVYLYLIAAGILTPPTGSFF